MTASVNDDDIMLFLCIIIIIINILWLLTICINIRNLNQYYYNHHDHYSHHDHSRDHSCDHNNGRHYHSHACNKIINDLNHM